MINEYVAARAILANMQSIGSRQDGKSTQTAAHVKALCLADKALEKQIPKKPNLEGDGYADGVLIYDTWICPHCDIRYEIDYDDYAYCPNCGQAIDWSGYDETI